LSAVKYIGSTERIYPLYKLIPLITHLVRAGVGVEQVLAGSGIAPAALGDPYARVSRQQVLTTFENFLRLDAGGVSPLRLGASFRLTDYGFYGYALLSSATVRDAVRFALQYRELATPIVELDLRETGPQAVWTIAPLPEIAAHAAMDRFVSESQSGILLSLQQSVSGNAFKLSSASFAFPAPANAADYHGVLNCAIAFDAPSTELRFDGMWLDQRPLGANAMTFQLVEDTCNDMLDSIGERRGLIGEIYRRLLEQSGRFASLDEMAVQLELHPRTLRRRLGIEGYAYQKIVDEVRFKLAASYLARTEMTHESMAERLGFSDASSFRRAFKRWSGRSPQEYRSRIAQAPHRS
jgi:AraC-like DNA-binding protein